MIFRRVKEFLFSGQERTKKAKKNIFWSFLLRIVNISTGIIIVPLVLTYLGSSKYGIWLTISSITIWLNFFDAGLGHGLRNRLSEAIANENFILAKKYVSTTYASISIIIISFFLLFLLINQNLNWSTILNSNIVFEHELKLSILFTFAFFGLRLVVQLINSVLYAFQKPALKELIETLGKILNVIIVFLLNKTTLNSSLLYIVLSYSISPVFILIIFSIILYNKTFKKIKPELKFIDFSYFKDLIGLGGKFFIIQISIVILYSTDNIIISHLFSTANVVPYQIANRYFSIILMVLSIISTPFWSAITESYVKGEIRWIKKSINSLLKIWMLSLIGLGIMLVLSNYVYNIWLGNNIEIPFIISCTWAVFIGIQSLNNIFMLVINGTGKIKLQMYVAMVGALTNIPLSIFLARNLNLGVAGVLIATIIYQSVCLLITYIQYNKIINGNLNGIWAR